jgi:hypothetical protein
MDQTLVHTVSVIQEMKVPAAPSYAATKPLPELYSSMRELFISAKSALVVRSA